MQRFYLLIHVVRFNKVEEEKEQSYEYRFDYIPATTPYNRRPGAKLEPTFITIHSTGNPSSTAKNERAWLTNTSNTSSASFHIVMDDKEAIEAIPLNEVAWHTGDGSGTDSGNCTSIGIEICESGNYQHTLKNAALLVANMLFNRNWGIDRLRRHYDWSNNNCPRLLNADGHWTGWMKFVDDVKEKLRELNQRRIEQAPNGITDNENNNGGEC